MQDDNTTIRRVRRIGYRRTASALRTRGRSKWLAVCLGANTDGNGEVVEGGYAPEHVVRCGVWLDEPRDFPSFNKIFSQYFGAKPPARACVILSMVVDCKVEIDCVAYRG